MITKLFRTFVRLVSKERTAGQTDRYAHGSDQIAEACAAAICDGNWKVITHRLGLDNREYMIELRKEQVAERIAKTLDAIHETRCEGTKPNA